MQPQAKTQYRFYRPRRPGNIGDGLRLDGVSNKFGLIGIGMLMLVGVAMLLVNNTPAEKTLRPVKIETTAAAYRTAKLRQSVLLPVTRARVLALHPATFAVADTAWLFGLDKGEQITAWLTADDAQKWEAGTGRKDFYRALLLQKSNGQWVVDYKTFRKKANSFNSQGWWIIIFALLLIPYQLIARPRISVWLAIGGFVVLVVLWHLFT